MNFFHENIMISFSTDKLRKKTVLDQSDVYTIWNSSMILNKHYGCDFSDALNKVCMTYETVFVGENLVESLIQF